MIDMRYDNQVQKDMLQTSAGRENLQFWFDFKKLKFLANIDTFYYSVKFINDFRVDSEDPKVHVLRERFKKDYRRLQLYEEARCTIPGLERLVLKPVTFSRFYTICLSYPEYFDIFLAPVVPKSEGNKESVTSECVVQIRSYMLWQMSVLDCFENSLDYVKKLAAYFMIDIDHVQENRIDYCWHSNYLDNPEKFFAPDNFYRMRVDRFKNATYVTNKVGAEDFEIDYVAMGKRSDKCFIRIYQKTREVIEQGYKPWFLIIWQQAGLISNYDKYVYEKAFKKRSWFYRFYARLEFYMEYGSDPDMIAKCKAIIFGDQTIEEQDLISLADKLTPRLHTIINVEYQTMRRMTKSYCLLDKKNRSNKGIAERVYKYLDNRSLITDYLTNKTFRLVEYDSDVKKSEREMCSFWKALRRTKFYDVSNRSRGKLVREYNKRLSKEAVSKRFINSAVTLGLYARGENSDHPMQDAFEAIMRLNDNDYEAAMKYKTKRLRQLNPDELAEVYESDEIHPFVIVDNDTGAFKYDSNAFRNKLQGGA